MAEDLDKADRHIAALEQTLARIRSQLKTLRESQ